MLGLLHFYDLTLTFTIRRYLYQPPARIHVHFLTLCCLILNVTPLHSWLGITWFVSVSVEANNLYLAYRLSARLLTLSCFPSPALLSLSLGDLLSQTPVTSTPLSYSNFHGKTPTCQNLGTALEPTYGVPNALLS